MNMQFTSHSIEDTNRLAMRIAALCAPIDCLLLRGDLGAGKTAFSRAFVQALCDTRGEIASPTFSLVQLYDTRSGGRLAHVDLYRLKHRQETEELGLQELLQEAICLIEWPQLIETYWPASALLVDIAYGQSENERMFMLQSIGGLWRERLAQLAGRS